MKTVLTILLCAALLLSLCACTVGNEAPGEATGESTAATAPLVTETPVTETPATETVPETTVATQPPETQPPETQPPETQPPETQPATEAVHTPVEPFSWLESLEEYNAVISRIDHPSLRVTYDDFSQIGKFKKARFYNADAENEAERDYMEASYSLEDETGTKFFLKISYSEDLSLRPWGEVELWDSEFDPKDMRRSMVDITSYYDYNGIRYHYYTGGRLQAVHWTAGDIEYSVLALVTFANHPLDREDSFISGLLKLETVEATIAQIDVFVD